MKVAFNPFLYGVAFKKTALHYTPSQKRRELISLIGAAIVFFVGFTVQSDPLGPVQHMVKSLVRLMLVCLGLAAPAVTNSPTVLPLAAAPLVAVPLVAVPLAAQPKRMSTPVKVVVRAGVPDSMQLNTLSNLKRYIYRFEGKATHEGAACSNASVLVRILSGDRTITTGGITNEDGTYSIEVPVLAADSEPVDWHMEAFSAEFQKLELSGRRIVQEEEERLQSPIVVTTPVVFVISSSK